MIVNNRSEGFGEREFAAAVQLCVAGDAAAGGDRADDRERQKAGASAQVAVRGPQPLIYGETKKPQVTASETARYVPAEGTYRRRCVSTEGAHRLPDVNYTRHEPVSHVNWRRHRAAYVSQVGTARGQGGDLSP